MDNLLATPPQYPLLDHCQPVEVERTNFQRSVAGPRTWDPNEQCEQAIDAQILAAANLQEHAQGGQDHGRNEPAGRGAWEQQGRESGMRPTEGRACCWVVQ